MISFFTHDVTRVEPNAATSAEKQYEQVKRLLREFPWLWSIRSEWNTQTRAYVCPATFESGWLLADMRDRPCCYLYLNSPHRQEVRRVPFTDEKPTMYDVLDQLGHQGIPLEAIKYVVTEDPVAHFLLIWRSKSFARIFANCVQAHHFRKPHTG